MREIESLTGSIIKKLDKLKIEKMTNELVGALSGDDEVGLFNMKDYYEAMENFAKNDRKESQICTSQSRLPELIGGSVVEIWHDRMDGKNISVTYQIDGSYLITNLD